MKRIKEIGKQRRDINKMSKKSAVNATHLHFHTLFSKWHQRHIKTTEKRSKQHMFFEQKPNTFPNFIDVESILTN